MMTDISHRTKVINLLDTSRAATAEATPAAEGKGAKAASARVALAAIDMFGFESCMFAVMGAGIGGSTLTINHGDSETELAVADELCLVQDAEATTTDKVKKLGYIGARRYVQLNCSVTPTAAVAILQRPDVVPKTKDDGTNI